MQDLTFVLFDVKLFCHIVIRTAVALHLKSEKIAFEIRKNQSV